MKRIVVWSMMILMVFPPIFLTGCANDAYEANMRYRTNKAMFKETGRTQAMNAITGAINAIISTVEGEYRNQKNQEINARFVDKSIVDGNNFAVAVLGDIVVRMNDSHVEAEMMRARADAIRYLEPIVANIYREETDNLGVPATSFDVASKFIGQIPFMATVFGMYKLGTAGIEKAGTSIANNINGDRNSIDQTDMQVGTGNYGDGNINGTQTTDDHTNNSTSTDSQSDTRNVANTTNTPTNTTTNNTNTTQSDMQVGNGNYGDANNTGTLSGDDNSNNSTTTPLPTP